MKQIPYGEFAENTCHVMQDLFKNWELPEHFVKGVSRRWKCQVIPLARNEDEIRLHTLHGDPVLLDNRYAQKVFDQVGDDALDYLIENPERNNFPRQKIAFVAGKTCLTFQCEAGRRVRVRGREGERESERASERERERVRKQESGWC